MKRAGNEPPSDLATEMAVLGYLMMPSEPTTYSLLEGVAKAEYFWTESSRYCFDAAMSVGQSGGVITAHTVAAVMRNRGLGDYIDGPDFFKECRDAAVGAPGDVLWYVGELRRLHLRRQLIEAAHTIMRISGDAEAEESDLIGSALEAVMAVGQDNKVDKGARSITEIIDGGVREQIDSITGLASSTVRYIPTGLNSLDHYIRGLRKSGLYLLSAPTSLGKSLFVQDRSIFLAETGNTSLIFTTEMADEDVVARQIFMLASLDEHRVRAEQRETDGIALSNAMDYGSGLPIWYKDSADLTIEKLEVTIHQEMRRKSLDVIVVDHFHELRTERRFARADEPLEYIAGRLKIIARTYDIPVVCVVQQNRGNHEGNLNALLKGTSALEQKADVIIFLQSMSDDGHAELSPDEARRRAGVQKWMRVAALITKVRTGGMTGTADLVMDWNVGGQFADWTRWEPMNRGRIQESAMIDIRNSATAARGGW